MKGLSFDVFHIGVVQVISDEGISKVFHMYANLMGTAGFQTKGDKAVSVMFGDDFIVSDCCLSICEIYGSFDDRSGFAGERRRDCSGSGGDGSARDGKIFSMDLMEADHVRENAAADQMFGNDGKA